MDEALIRDLLDSGLIKTGFFVAIILLSFYRLMCPKTSRKIAASMETDLDKVYGPYHELREVSLQEMPGVDLQFYDTAQRTLEQAGFRKLGDVEDLTLSAAFPKTRTFFRVMTTGDGHILAHIYHIKIHGVQRWWAMGFRLMEERVVDLDSCLENCTFVSTSNRRDAPGLKRPPEIAALSQPGLAIEPLVEVHRARLWQALRTGVVPVPVTTLQEAFYAFNAMQAIKSRFRAALALVGALDEKEPGAILKGQPKGSVAKIASA
jgi:hypothetical protein